MIAISEVWNHEIKQEGTHLPSSVVISKIYMIRGQKVMLDFDLAELYRVETKHLNQSVRRNKDRFPPDFMFQLTQGEWNDLRSQFVTSNKVWGGRRYAPYAFTEYGVLMLSSVLNSDRAIQVNIQIMRIYAPLKEAILDHKDILFKLEKLERRLSLHDDNFKLVFEYLRELISPKIPTRAIGFVQKGR